MTTHTHIHPRRPANSFIHRLSRDPYLDWLIMVVTFAIVSIVLIVVGYLSQVTTDLQLSAPIEVSAQNQRSLFDSQGLTQVLKEFEDRARERSALIKGYTGVADPSL